MTFLRLAAVLALGFGVITACSDSTSSGGGGGHTTSLTVGNNFFSPTPDTVPAGVVTFTWSTPSNGHNVTWSTGPAPLPTNSNTQNSGTYQATLKNGTYSYHCTVHPGMNGTIIVQ
jgi:plastocyanin